MISKLVIVRGFLLYRLVNILDICLLWCWNMPLCSFCSEWLSLVMALISGNISVAPSFELYLTTVPGHQWLPIVLCLDVLTSFAHHHTHCPKTVASCDWMTLLVSQGQKVEFHCVEFAAVRVCEAFSLCCIMECKARNPQSFAHLHREIGTKIAVERNSTGPFLCPCRAKQLVNLGGTLFHILLN